MTLTAVNRTSIQMATTTAFTISFGNNKKDKGKEKNTKAHTKNRKILNKS